VLVSAAPCALLFSTQPVSNSNSNPTDALYSSDSGGQFGAEEAGVGGFKRYPSNGSQAQIDGCRCELLLFEIDPVSQDQGTVEYEPRFEVYQPAKSVIARS
jgi:hypothetical protein